MRSKTGNRIKVRTQCAPEIQEPDEDNTIIQGQYATTSYSHNPNTTKSWPVIYRSSDQSEYDTLFVLNNNNGKCEKKDPLFGDEEKWFYERYRASIAPTSNHINFGGVNLMHSQVPERGHHRPPICNPRSPVFFLLATLLITICATSMLCGAIMTDYWEQISWNSSGIDQFLNTTNRIGHRYFDGKVTRILVKNHYNHQRGNIFLVPMHGGIWTLCTDLEEIEINFLRQYDYSKPVNCENYLAGVKENHTNDENRADWQHSEWLYTKTGAYPNASNHISFRHHSSVHRPDLRMQNLSISCALVCLIILGSAALVGAFGVCQKQISAILVTGVMYLLAALFALFTLMIIHFKRQHLRDPEFSMNTEGVIDGIVVSKGVSMRIVKSLMEHRIITTSWSLDLGWGGVCICTITSIMWILLSKIMRYNPLSSLLL